MTAETTSLLHTFTGRELNPLDLFYHDIVIEDIAHSLALCNRFAGHTKKPISVAQHSVFVARIAFNTAARSPRSYTEEWSPNLVGLQALLDDASEAYFGDITRWVKRTPPFTMVRQAETEAQKKIFARFGVPVESFPEVKEADRIMVRFEGMKGLGKDFKIDHPDYPPLTQLEINSVGKWGFWTWKTAEEVFLYHYRMHTHGLTVR